MVIYLKEIICESPTENEIENLNRDCYNNIANEYADQNHGTCRDFDEVTRLFLNIYIEGKYGENKLTSNCRGLRYLDIGVGTGTTLETVIHNDTFEGTFLELLHQLDARVEVLDISKSMLDIVRNKFDNKVDDYINKSIFGYSSNTRYDLVVATMCDPYLTDSFIKVASCLLADNGVLLLSFPHCEWMKKVRHGADLNKAVFKNSRGETRKCYSFARRATVLFDNFYEHGVALVNYNIRYLNDLSSTRTLSDINRGLIDNHGESKFCSCVVLKKNKGKE